MYLVIVPIYWYLFYKYVFLNILRRNLPIPVHGKYAKRFYNSAFT